MEKVKAIGKKVADAGKAGKSKIDEIRTKDWAEPTGAVLKAAANAASLLPPPVGGVIKGALNMGGSLLNPDPTLADLRRAKEEIQDEVRSTFKEVAQEMSEIEDDLSALRNNIDDLLEIITEKEFYRGIEEVNANHEYFMEGVENLEKTIEEFRTEATAFQTSFKRNFKIKKIFNYLKIVKQREGNKACEQFYHELLSAYGKFLQIIVVYLTFNGEHHRIEKLFSKFTKDFSELSALFNGIQEIPEGEEVILKRQEAIQIVTADMENLVVEVAKNEKNSPRKRQETIKRGKAETKEEFDEAELISLKKSATRMEMNAEFGFIEEANVLYGLLFDKMKEKKFKPSQRQMKVEILVKIVSFHNIKYCYDEAVIWSTKALELLEANDPASLLIETLNQSARAFTAKSLFSKSKAMIEKAVVLSAETYGAESRCYAESLIHYANYLNSTDQIQKAKAVLEIALKIVSKEEGERSVASAQILLEMAAYNYRIQSRSSKDFKEASEQAETAMQVIEEKLGKNNFLNADAKNVLAIILKAKAKATSGEEKAKLLDEAEKLEEDYLAICLTSLGEYNPATATAMSCLGSTYRKSGKISEAEELLIKALKIKEKILGEDSSVANNHVKLADLYFDNLEDFVKAELHFIKNIEMEEKMHGPALSTLGNTYKRLISLYRKTGEVEKEKAQREKRNRWKKLQEKRDKDNKEEKRLEMNMEELIRFVTVSDTNEP